MAALARLALGKHKDFTVSEVDTVIISARTIPGNETRISHLINHFCRRGSQGLSTTAAGRSTFPDTPARKN